MKSGESADIQPGDRYVTPVELSQTRFKRSVRGYDPDEVEAFLARLRKNYSELYKERLALAVEVRTLQDEINRLDADQNLIHQVLVDARRSADELRADGARDADLIREDARQQAAAIVHEANLEVERLNDQLQRLRERDGDMRAGYRAFLLAALELVDGAGPRGSEVEASGSVEALQPSPAENAEEAGGPEDGREPTPLRSLETARYGSST